LVLQNCTDLLKVVPDPYSETCPTSSYDMNQVLSIKVEEITDIKAEEEEDPLLITCPGTKDEHEVSCISVIFHF
jgi:hypothetical protein